MSLNEKEPSELIFGWIDHSRYYGSLVWYPVVDKFFWTIELDDIKLNGQPLGICNGIKCGITTDSGTSTITFPTWAWTEVSNIFPEHKNCNSDRILGSMTFVIGGDDYTIPSHHYYEMIEQDDDTVSCETTISPLDIHLHSMHNLFIVGDTFMNIFYCVFDRDNDRIGIALAKHVYDESDVIFDSFG